MLCHTLMMDAAEEYLEKNKPFITDENRHRFEAMAKMRLQPLTLDQARAQFIRHQAVAALGWARPGEPIPPEVEQAIQDQIKAEGLDTERPFDPETDGGLNIPDTTR